MGMPTYNGWHRFIRRSGMDCRNPDAMDGGASKRPCNLDTGNPCRYDGFSTHITTPDGICNPVRNVLYLPGSRGFAQNLSGGVTNPAALRAKTHGPDRLEVPVGKINPRLLAKAWRFRPVAGGYIKSLSH